MEMPHSACKQGARLVSSWGSASRKILQSCFVLSLQESLRTRLTVLFWLRKQCTVFYCPHAHAEEELRCDACLQA